MVTKCIILRMVCYSEIHPIASRNVYYNVSIDLHDIIYTYIIILMMIHLS